MTLERRLYLSIAAAVLVWLAQREGVLPVAPTVPPADVTAVVYVHEQREHPVPPAVLAGLDRLNRERGVMATLFDQHTTDATGQTPAQYTAALAAAREAGLPALVVLSRDRVVRVVRAPTTLEQVLEAAQ